VALLTRWPIGALLAGALGWAWPGLFATKKVSRQAIDRIEAIAVWAEMLRGMMVSAASIEQAIMATVPRAPAPIRAEVARLADRLAAGESLVTALRPLADAINDDVGDLVVGALLLAADPSQKAGGLARQLAELAVRARQKAGYRQRVQTGRARIYASARAIIVITLGMVAALLVFAREFLSPYASPVGQLALLAIGAIFGLGFALLARLGRMRIAERFLATTTQPEAGRGDPAGPAGRGDAGRRAVAAAVLAAAGPAVAGRLAGSAARGRGGSCRCGLAQPGDQALAAAARPRRRAGRPGRGP
jgi:tight adherence protein B